MISAAYNLIVERRAKSLLIEMIDVSSFFFFFFSDIHSVHGRFVWVSSDWCSPPRSCIAGNAG